MQTVLMKLIKMCASGAYKKPVSGPASGGKSTKLLHSVVHRDASKFYSLVADFTRST